MKDHKNSILKLVVWLVCTLGAILFLGGVFATLRGLVGQTQITLFGQQFNSTAVGVALAFIGAVMVILTMRGVLAGLKNSGSGESIPTKPPKSGQVQGGIDQPKPGQAMERTCQCSGWASSVGPDMHLWLAVELGGLVWPKEGEIHPDSNNRWNGVIFEDGANDEFSLALYVANEDGHRRIRDWFEIGKRSGQYAEMRGIAGVQRIARIDRLRLSK